MTALEELRAKVAAGFPGEIWKQRHPSGTECYLYSTRAMLALFAKETPNAD